MVLSCSPLADALVPARTGIAGSLRALSATGDRGKRNALCLSDTLGKRACPPNRCSHRRDHRRAHPGLPPSATGGPHYTPRQAETTSFGRRTALRDVERHRAAWARRRICHQPRHVSPPQPTTRATDCVWPHRGGALPLLRAPHTALPCPSQSGASRRACCHKALMEAPGAAVPR